MARDVLGNFTEILQACASLGVQLGDILAQHGEDGKGHHDTACRAILLAGNVAAHWAGGAMASTDPLAQAALVTVVRICTAHYALGRIDRLETYWALA